VLVGREGIDGDEQADRRYHGGPDKAILAYSADHYAHWQSELGMDLPSGSFGENLTVAGLSEETVCLGDIWRLGSVELQVSQPRQPCWKLSARWGIADLTRRVAMSGRTGWYLRVLQTGQIEAGMPMVLIRRPYGQWSVRRANDAMFGRLEDRVALVELAAMTELAASWKADLT
jgi:MOSC domain-containing protein YiiM